MMKKTIIIHNADTDSGIKISKKLLNDGYNIIALGKYNNVNKVEELLCYEQYSYRIYNSNSIINIDEYINDIIIID